MKQKLWCGNPPNLKDWIQVGELEKLGWLLFLKLDSLNGEWKNYKLISNRPIAGKANYRFSWNGDRFADHPSICHLKQFRPNLFEIIQQAVQEVCE